MFNLQPGQGLGTSIFSSLLGMGLGIVDFVKTIVKKGSARTKIKENFFAARIRREDEEVLIIISQFLFLEGT